MPTEQYDQHLHSRFSWDCETDPRENVLAALQQGLAGLTFTEHFDTHPEEWDMCGYDHAAYTAAINNLRDEFGDRILIGKGLEVCFQPQRMEFILDTLARGHFDLLILSVHWCEGRLLARRADWAGLDVVAGTRMYLRTVLEAARVCAGLRRKHGRRLFDVLGHIDFVKRYSRRFFDDDCADEQTDLIDEILETCLEADLVPEVNTSTYRQGMDQPMPGRRTVERLVECGGRTMTLGSDAHLRESIGQGFAPATEILRKAGIEHLAVFRERERELVPLE